MAGKKGECGAKKKTAEQKTHTVVLMVKGSVVKGLGDELKLNMKQADYPKTKEFLMKQLNQVPIL